MHLALLRNEVNPDRRKQSAPPRATLDRGTREAFTKVLGGEITRLEHEVAAQPPVAPGIKPHLVFRVPVARDTSAVALVKPLKEVGIRVLNVDPDGAVIAFREDANLTDFKEALEICKAGPKINPKTQKPFGSTKWDIFEIIDAENMRCLTPADRIGPHLSSEIGPDGGSIDNQKLYILDIELWHSGSKDFAGKSLEELEQVIADEQKKDVADERKKDVDEERKKDEKVRDRFLGDLFCLARVSVYGPKLRKLLNLPVVAEIEFPPVPTLNATEVVNATRRDFPTPPMPPEGGPSVCILDTGVNSNHPLLANNIGYTDAIMTNDPSPADVRGHGTKVAGVAVYGDVLAAYRSGTFSSPITLYSARVLNSQGRFDDDVLLIKQIGTAIKTFADSPYNCRVFNLSLGGELPVLTGPNDRQTPWAEALDTLAREMKVLIVVAAGNHKLDEAATAAEAEQVLNEYPSFLFEPGASLGDPATAAIAVSVGGIAEHEAPELWDGEDQTDEIDRPVARKNQPTPSTRIGPGVNGAYKPDFVAFGGNSALRGFGSLNREISSSMGYGVFTLNHNFQVSLFAADVGTSFAAPRIARLAALVWHRLNEMGVEDAGPNLVRALLANSASVPPATQELITARKGKEFVAYVCGYGVPDLEFASHSGNRRVTMIDAGSIKIDTFHLYEVPITEEFLQAKGRKEVIVSLAFDPPVRRRRKKYLGVDMNLALIRGKTPEEIVAAYRSVTNEEKRTAPKSFQGSFKCPLNPGAKRLESSTLHRCSWSFSKKSRDYGDTYYLIVRADRNWAPKEITHQDFAVVVTLLADDENLYASVQQRIQPRARARGRV